MAVLDFFNPDQSSLLMEINLKQALADRDESGYTVPKGAATTPHNPN